MSWEGLMFYVTPGVTSITGWNADDNTSEGCGKSAMFNAICWCLFGCLPKDTNTDDVIKDGSKSCSVTVQLDNGDEIIRTRKPNDLYIYDDAKQETVRGKDARQTQQLIEAFIGFSYETFLQSCYFAQNSQVKFLLANEENKVKILSDLADLSSFDVARKKAHELVKDLGMKIYVLEGAKEQAEKSIELLKGQIITMRSMRGKFETEHAQRLSELDTQQAEMYTEIHYLSHNLPELTTEFFAKKEEVASALETYRKHLVDTQVNLARVSELKLRKQNLEMEVKALKEEAAQFHPHTGRGECPVCGTSVSNIDPTKLKVIAAEYKEKIVQKVKEFSALNFDTPIDLQEQHDFYKATVQAMEEDLKEIETIEFSHKAQKDKLKWLIIEQKKLTERHQKEKVKDFGDLDSRIVLINKAISEQQEQLIQVCDKIKEFKFKSDQYDVLKEGFKEVKMYAFQGMLQELNLKANEYLSQLFEQQISIKFFNGDDSGNISKIQTGIEFDGTTRSLGLFSGGQTRRIMLAVDLALSDLAQARSVKPINLLILDEYFKDLSFESMEKIYRLLEQRQGSILLVEHNEIFKQLATKTFEIEYKDGTSHVKSTDQ